VRVGPWPIEYPTPAITGRSLTSPIAVFRPSMGTDTSPVYQFSPMAGPHPVPRGVGRNTGDTLQRWPRSESGVRTWLPDTPTMNFPSRNGRSRFGAPAWTAPDDSPAGWGDACVGTPASAPAIVHTMGALTAPGSGEAVTDGTGTPGSPCAAAGAASKLAQRAIAGPMPTSRPRRWAPVILRRHRRIPM